MEIFILQTYFCVASSITLMPPHLNTRLIGQVLAHATTFTIVLNHALIYWHNYEYGKYFFASSSFMLGQFFVMI